MTALHAEWTKARTVPGTPLLLAGVVALTAVVGVLTAQAVSAGGDPVKSTLTGVALGQAAVVVLAVGTVSGEYGTGMIRITLTVVPHRLKVLAAKSFVVTALTLVAGAAAVLASLAVGDALVPEGLSLSDGATSRAAVGSVLYLGLIALLSIGVAALVRDAAAAVGVVLSLLYLTPLVTALVSDPDWRDRLQKLSPMTAGLSVQATTRLDQLPIGPWQGLGVLALWAAGALTAGAVALRLRDA
ncbi:ABC transporter permease [Actinophytocola oryzae]|uniref:ABC-2 type transport system permease protein n=1 Tax=Actinophytocola oryzae TaxID=502181 RepID=A0A4V3FU22_9PSEU|nr:ABC transporter permease [Actinophytocola oryzae]TDV53551.1 ABC-2 type transport system permease protein [Actinophytocola oryzae]